MGSLLRNILGTIVNDNRDPYVGCQEPLNRAKIDAAHMSYSLNS